jgi:predicted ATPase with chaperone activity
LETFRSNPSLGLETGENQVVHIFILTPAMRQVQPTARVYHRVLKLSRTIADLAEALQYSPKLDLM